MSFWAVGSKARATASKIRLSSRSASAVVTLACVVLVVVAALVIGLFVSNDIVDSDKVFEIVGPAFNMVIGAFVGLLGGLSLNANARGQGRASCCLTRLSLSLSLSQRPLRQRRLKRYQLLKTMMMTTWPLGSVPERTCAMMPMATAWSSEDDFPDWRNAG